jgi:LacI family transcriptional regulator
MEADGYQAMRTLLALDPPIDAVFAANDPAAIGAMKAIWEAGLRVPEDIAVVGAGDIAHGDLLRSAHDRRLVEGRTGSEGGGTAPEQILSPDTTTFRRVVIPPRLVVRESCGAGRKLGSGLVASESDRCR